MWVYKPLKIGSLYFYVDKKSDGILCETFRREDSFLLKRSGLRTMGTRNTMHETAGSCRLPIWDGSFLAMAAGMESSASASGAN